MVYRNQNLKYHLQVSDWRLRLEPLPRQEEGAQPYEQPPAVAKMPPGKCQSPRGNQSTWVIPLSALLPTITGWGTAVYMSMHTVMCMYIVINICVCRYIQWYTAVCHVILLPTRCSLLLVWIYFCARVCTIFFEGQPYHWHLHFTALRWSLQNKFSEYRKSLQQGRAPFRIFLSQVFFLLLLNIFVYFWLNIVMDAYTPCRLYGWCRPLNCCLGFSGCRCVFNQERAESGHKHICSSVILCWSQLVISNLTHHDLFWGRLGRKEYWWHVCL